MRAALRFVVPFLLVACAADGPDPAGPVDPGGGGPDPNDPPVGDGSFSVGLDRIAQGLDNPVLAIAPPGDARLFIVEQPGRIRILRDGTVAATPFLDLTDRVAAGGERGLLGLAFHPDFAGTGRFFVNYTHVDGTTRIERFEVGADPDRADAGSGVTLLSVYQPFPNHNGGHLEFGPDGMLYIALGDGGGSADPDGNGQSVSTLLGKILRIDVDAATPYGIPQDNPFAGSATARPEIWAYGLRNPWRFSFDAPTGRIYIADVGETAREEVNVARASDGGLNYGWSVMEGSACFRTSSCSTEGLTLPVIEYTHEEGRCSVTGGRTYRGAAIPEMAGYYLYADYCRGWIRSFRLEADTAADHRQWDVPSPGRITSFGRDAEGELYVVTTGGAAGGAIYRIVPND